MIDIDERIIGHATMDIKSLASYAEQLSSQWDGDESGTLENIASICGEISTKCSEIETLLKELEDY